MVIFACAQCGIPITVPLVELDDVERVDFDDEAPHVPRGVYLPVRRHPFKLWVEDMARRGEADDVIVNLDDALNTHLGSKCNGCCGCDGCDGINTFCPNNHEIGTETSDCWTPHYLQLATRCVVVLPPPSQDRPDVSSD